MNRLANPSYRQHILSFLAIASGCFVGSIASSSFLSGMKELTSLFTNLLKLLSSPLIFLAIVSTLTKFGNRKEMGTLLKKILQYTLITTLTAATIGLFLFLFLDPPPLTTSPIAPPLPLQSLEQHPYKANYLASLKAIIPDNLLQPFLSNHILSISFLATLLSIALLHLPKETATIPKSFFQALFDAFLFLTTKLLGLMPLAIFSFTAICTAEIKTHSHSLVPLLLYATCVLGANFLQGFLFLPLLLKRNGISPFHVAKGMAPALFAAFISKSSTIALPLSLESSIHRLRMSDKTARIGFPLCSIINMNGCAAFILITTLFVSKSYGIVFSPWQLALSVGVASLVAIGNAGVPMGCFFLTSAILVGMGIPLEILGWILPFYSVFDMVETALNVWSDSCVLSIVDRKMASVPHSLSSPTSSLSSRSSP